MRIGNINIADITLPLKISGKRTSHSILNTLGQLIIYSAGYNEKILEVSVKFTAYSEILDLKNFIENTAAFRKNIFQIVPDSGLDLGNGLGAAVNARYWSDEFKYSIENNKFYTSELKFKLEE